MVRQPCLDRTTIAFVWIYFSNLKTQLLKVEFDTNPEDRKCDDKVAGAELEPSSLKL